MLTEAEATPRRWLRSSYASASDALAADKSLISKGELLAKENCSRCHAIGKDGDARIHRRLPFGPCSANTP